jgi:hypothetical protein
LADEAKKTSHRNTTFQNPFERNVMVKLSNTRVDGVQLSGTLYLPVEGYDIVKEKKCHC